VYSCIDTCRTISSANAIVALQLEDQRRAQHHLLLPQESAQGRTISSSDTIVVLELEDERHAQNDGLLPPEYDQGRSMIDLRRRNASPVMDPSVAAAAWA